jgi:hypothetical protein
MYILENDGQHKASEETMIYTTDTPYLFLAYSSKVSRNLGIHQPLLRAALEHFTLQAPYHICN